MECQTSAGISFNGTDRAAAGSGGGRTEADGLAVVATLHAEVAAVGRCALAVVIEADRITPGALAWDVAVAATRCTCPRRVSPVSLSCPGDAAGRGLGAR